MSVYYRCVSVRICYVIVFAFIFVTVKHKFTPYIEASTAVLNEEAMERTEQSLREALKKRREGRLLRIDLSSVVFYVPELDGKLSNLDLEDSENERNPLPLREPDQ